MPENSVAEFDIVYANSKGDKLAAQDVEVRLIRERRNYSDSEGWQMRHDEKDLQEDAQRITLSAGNSQKVGFPVESGSYRLDAPLKTRPEQTLKVKVKASRTGGELPAQIQVLLSAVDSGVLNINDYKTPDPWDRLLRQ